MKKRFVNWFHAVNFGTLIGQVALQVASGGTLSWKNALIWILQAGAGAAAPSAGGVMHKAIFGTSQETGALIKKAQ